MADQKDLKAWFTRGIEENMDSLYAVALRLTRNNADTEDLVAESVAKAWAAITSLEDRNRFRPWMFRILHNCFISDYRKNPCVHRKPPTKTLQVVVKRRYPTY